MRLIIFYFIVVCLFLLNIMFFGISNLQELYNSGTNKIHNKIDSTLYIPASKQYAGTVNYRGYLVPYAAICGTNLSSNMNNCSSYIPLTVQFAGNTGNQILEYLSVYALSKLYRHKMMLPFVNDGNKHELEEIFQHLSIPASSRIEKDCRIRDETRNLRLADPSSIIESLNSSTAVVLNYFSARYDDIIKSGLDDVRKELRFKPEHVDVAMNTLSALKEKFQHPNGTEPTYVGVHYRGGDFVAVFNSQYQDFKHDPSPYQYYQKAMNFFTEKYPHVVFILFTIDFYWLKINQQHFRGNVEVTPYKNSRHSKIKDIVLLSHCNHTIINYGTFGSVTALLSGGTTIAYDLKFPLDFRGPSVAIGIASILDNWILMS